MPPGLPPSAPLRSARLLVAQRGVRYLYNSPTQNISNSPVQSISKSPTQSSTIAPIASVVPTAFLPSSQPSPQGKQPSLSVLPLNNVFRTYLITTMSSSPVMLNACLSVLNLMLKSKSQLLDPEKNRYLGWLFKKSFYAQFCAGENPKEVQVTSNTVKGLGYQGIILEYCLEVLERELEDTDGNDPTTLQEIETWKKGMLDTLSMANPRDFVALKWSGLGAYALTLLKSNKPPTQAMASAIKEICDTAYEKGVRLLPGAEWEMTNVGIDSWTLNLQRQYNKNEVKGAIIFNTYQAYLKSTPANVARRLAIAQQEGFIPAIKLVRGAYMATEPRNLIWDTKEDTDKAYDDIMEGLMRRKSHGLFQAAPGLKRDFPESELVLATHNQDSVRKSQAIIQEQQQASESPIPVTYAQLYGMADDLSCQIVQDLQEQERQTGMWPGIRGQPQAFKSISWGTMTQCLHFLHRRATENMDAAMRTEDTRRAMQTELWRRFTRPFRWT